MRNWARAAALAVGLLVAGTNAQTGTLVDLGSLLSSQKNLSTFYGMIQKYPNILLKLPSANGVTVLVPSNEAFEKIPYSSLNDAFSSNNETVITNILEYHILQGQRMARDLVPGQPTFIPTLLQSPAYTNVTGGQRVENVKQAGDAIVFVSGQGRRSSLVQADLSFTGGVVQVIDALLIPPTPVLTTAETYNFTSYEGALFAANKMQNYSTTPDLTLLVPNNEAFMRLGSAISNLTTEQLADVLDYHVLPELLYSTGFLNGTVVQTLGGRNLTISRSGNNVFINSAQLLTSDILTANGIIHVIDNVLNPLAAEIKPVADVNIQPPQFANANTVDAIPFTSAIPCSSACPVTTTSGTTTPTGSASGRAPTTTRSTSTSKGQAAAMARETGLGAAGLMAALGGVVLMI